VKLGSILGSSLSLQRFTILGISLSASVRTGVGQDLSIGEAAQLASSLSILKYYTNTNRKEHSPSKKIAAILPGTLSSLSSLNVGYKFSWLPLPIL
jgi:hypothetical protein